MAAKPAFTTVLNISGGKKNYTFLPPHGVCMNAGQSITVIGELNDRLIPGWPYHTDKDRPPNRTKLQAITQAEAAKQLCVIRSKAPHRHEALTQAFSKLTTLGVIDPNYKELRCVEYSSS